MRLLTSIYSMFIIHSHTQGQKLFSKLFQVCVDIVLYIIFFQLIQTSALRTACKFLSSFPFLLKLFIQFTILHIIGKTTTVYSYTVLFEAKIFISSRRVCAGACIPLRRAVRRILICLGGKGYGGRIA